jgi:hypothetical protein
LSSYLFTLSELLFNFTYSVFLCNGYGKLSKLKRDVLQGASKLFKVICCTPRLISVMVLPSRSTKRATEV